MDLLCNHGNLTLKLHQKNSYPNEGQVFIGRFKVGSLPRKTNKEVLGACSLRWTTKLDLKKMLKTHYFNFLVLQDHHQFEINMLPL